MMVTIMTGFDATNLRVRQVITPDGQGEYVFRDVDDPAYVYVMIRIDGKKPAQFRRYEVSKLQEITGGKNE
jgi:hypothetical protein